MEVITRKTTTTKSAWRKDGFQMNSSFEDMSKTPSRLHALACTAPAKLVLLPAKAVTGGFTCY